VRLNIGHEASNRMRNWARLYFIYRSYQAICYKTPIVLAFTWDAKCSKRLDLLKIVRITTEYLINHVVLQVVSDNKKPL